MESIKVTKEEYDKVQEYLDSNTIKSNIEFIDYVIGAFKIPKEYNCNITIS